MKDELISLETAKLAKEKGFDINTNAFHARLESKVVYMLPTQSLLQKWLREVHKLSIHVHSYWANSGKTKSVYISFIHGNKDWDKEDDIKDEDYCDTYEEALEKGLIEALNLIP